MMAFAIAYKLHYSKIVRNEYYGYPDEWMPSVSAVIGDRFPERNLFQFMMAAAGFSRLLLVVCSALFLESSMIFLIGFARTALAGAWIYVPSGDCNAFHDLAMILYLAMTIINHIVLLKRLSIKSRSRSKRLLTCLIVTIFPMVLFFTRHKVYKQPGAYSFYAMVEWLLVPLDVMLDYNAFTDLLGYVHLQLISNEKRMI